MKRLYRVYRIYTRMHISSTQHTHVECGVPTLPSTAFVDLLTYSEAMIGDTTLCPFHNSNSRSTLFGPPSQTTALTH